MARAGKSTTAAAPRLNPAQTWLGVPAGMPGRGCRAAIVGVPFDCGTHPTRIGARLGPSAIREQSHNLRRFDPRTNLDVVAALGLVDCGDVAVTPSDVEKSYAAIESAIEAVIADGAVAVTMGGDGAVSLPQIRAAARAASRAVASSISTRTPTPIRSRATTPRPVFAMSRRKA